MQALFIVLAIAGYFGFLIDWKEFGGVIREGGWAALVYFCLIGIAIAVAMAAPEAATAPAVHH
jgi:hypothetical protein